MPKSEVAYRGVELVEDQDHAPLAADAPNSSCSQSHDLRLVMSEIEADLDDLEAEDVDADASKDAAAMEVDGERMERLISQERRRRCVIRAGLCACGSCECAGV